MGRPASTCCQGLLPVAGGDAKAEHVLLREAPLLAGFPYPRTQSLWGTSKTALKSTTAQIAVFASASSQNVAVPLTGMVTKTTYYFQPVVSSIAGTTYGAIQSFTTE